MELNSVKLTPVQKRKIYLNHLRNPISDLHQWNALKDEDIKASKQRSNEKSVNLLLKLVSNLSEWRDILAKDTKSMCNVHEWSVSTTEDTKPIDDQRSCRVQQAHTVFQDSSLNELDQITAEATLSCWLPSSENILP
ncbi:hypothetical protein V6N13_090380 [Hibiscus sabdariffa]|uniref:Uncharacterized protein n=2 Tax=Hibiscus sabdariffa TaxID=183260 RepID=A0ABR2C0M8_9ROSI